jgi:glycosyltransferase involved in cell wall biosynthesis
MWCAADGLVSSQPSDTQIWENHAMSANVTISIITITKNCASTLPDCIASVFKQSYTDRQHVIVDGASDDGTLNVIHQFREQISTFISEPDKGIYDALNKGIGLAKGEIIGFLHADDVYASDAVLARIAQAFEDPTVCAVYGDLEYVNQMDSTKIVRRWRGKPFNKHDLARGWMPAHPTLYVRREWYSRINGFDTSYAIAADYLSILQLFSQPGFNTVYLPQVLVQMRLGGASNRSLNAIIKKSCEDWRALRSCGYSIPKTIRAVVWKNLSKLSQFF